MKDLDKRTVQQRQARRHQQPQRHQRCALHHVHVKMGLLPEAKRQFHCQAHHRLHRLLRCPSHPTNVELVVVVVVVVVVTATSWLVVWMSGGSR